MASRQSFEAAMRERGYSATRRVARAIFMGSAPTHAQKNKGLDDKQINLGVVQPGERPAIFGDALRRLTNQAKYMIWPRDRSTELSGPDYQWAA